VSAIHLAMARYPPASRPAPEGSGLECSYVSDGAGYHVFSHKRGGPLVPGHFVSWYSSLTILKRR
jgi:hypothetical protein